MASAMRVANQSETSTFLDSTARGGFAFSSSPKKSSSSSGLRKSNSSNTMWSNNNNLSSNARGRGLFVHNASLLGSFTASRTCACPKDVVRGPQAEQLQFNSVSRPILSSSKSATYKLPQDKCLKSPQGKQSAGQHCHDDTAWGNYVSGIILHAEVARTIKDCAKLYLV